MADPAPDPTTTPSQPEKPKRIPTVLPMDICFRADDVVPGAATVLSPHTRPRMLTLWISIHGAIQLAHGMLNAAIFTPKTPDGIVSFALPAHLFRDGEEPILRQPGEEKKAGLVDADGVPV